MSELEKRARQSWLLSFGDLATLLICFFIMMIAVNKSEITKIHVWIESQLEESRQYLATTFVEQGFRLMRVDRDSTGVVITIDTPEAFLSAQSIPSPALSDELSRLGELLPSVPIFHVSNRFAALLQEIELHGMDWHTEVIVEGHTDNDPIAANSRLRNNWELSALRAQYVMRLLQANSQLPESLFTVTGFSEYHPVANNDSAEGKAKNRRINIRINAAILKRQATANR